MSRNIRLKTIPLLLVAALAGCQGPGAGGGPGTGAIAATPPLSALGTAAYADLVRGADGTLHAAFRERSRSASRDMLFYRASKDGGATWSPAVELSEGERERNVGFLRLAQDGAGRVYAIWWYAATPTGGDANTAGDASNRGTLVYRVLENGAWSGAVTVGQEKNAYAWFPATDPAGAVVLTWVDNVEGGDYPSRIVQATLTGAQAGAPRTLHEPPAEAYSETVDYMYRASYRGLRGYVDAAGKTRWVAQRRAPKATGDAWQLVYFDGAAETTLFDAGRLGAVNDMQNPALLFPDAQGKPHVLALDKGGERAAIVDVPADAPASAAKVREVAEPAGEILGLQASLAPGGKLLAFAGVKDAKAAEAHEMLLLRFDGAAWAQAANLTDNAGRAAAFRASSGDGTAVAAATRYRPRFGAGALGPDGKAYMLLVNDENGLFGRTGYTEVGTLGGYSGSATTSHVFFAVR